MYIESLRSLPQIRERVHMLKIIGALIAGLIVGMAANMILVTLNLKLFPASTPLNNPEAWNDYIVSLPDTAFIIPVLAHLSQAFFGAWVTARLSPTQPFKFAMAIGVLSLLGGIVNASSLPIPIWMWLEMPFYLILAGVAGKIEMNRRGS